MQGSGFQWNNHHRKHPIIVHSPTLRTIAIIHGFGEEKRRACRGLSVSLGEYGGE